MSAHRTSLTASTALPVNKRHLCYSMLQPVSYRPLWIKYQAVLGLKKWQSYVQMAFLFLISAAEHFCSVYMKFLIKRRQRGVGFVRIGPLMFAWLGLYNFLLLMSMLVSWRVWHSVQKISTARLRFKCREGFILYVFYPIGVKFRTLTQKYFEWQVLYNSTLKGRILHAVVKEFVCVLVHIYRLRACAHLSPHAIEHLWV
jgi:hypothetical protein